MKHYFELATIAIEPGFLNVDVNVIMLAELNQRLMCLKVFLVSFQVKLLKKGRICKLLFLLTFLVKVFA